MSMYGDGPDEPPTELELEQQRAGVDPGADRVSDEVASPLWVAGLGPTSVDYGRSSSGGDSSGGRRGIRSRIRSMFARRR
jgi:hypothetical protein